MQNGQLFPELHLPKGLCGEKLVVVCPFSFVVISENRYYRQKEKYSISDFSLGTYLHNTLSPERVESGQYRCAPGVPASIMCAPQCSVTCSSG